MPQVRMWKCPKTGKLFEDLDEYRQHLREVASERFMRRKAVDFVRAATSELRCQSSFEDIAEWIVANSTMLAVRAAYHNAIGWRQGEPNLIPPFFFIRHVEFKDMEWREAIRHNNHAPLGQPTDRDVASSGWYGRLIFRAKGDHYCITRDLFAETGINLCNGVGGDGRYRYQVILFDEDFPNLSVMSRLRQEAA